MNTEIVENPFVYLERIQIEALWNNPAINIDWKLNHNVNILAGGNGSGKTTILETVWEILKDNNDKFINREYNTNEKFKRVVINFTNGCYVNAVFRLNVKNIITDVRRKKHNFNLSFFKGSDTPLLPLEAIQRITNQNVKTHLDYTVFLAENNYKDYQIRLGRKYREPNANFTKLSEKINLFYELVNQHFKETGKVIDTEATGFSFKLGETQIPFYELSSGEKQILIILNMALVQDEEPCIFILDEPEVSLHTDWQKDLIDNILLLNPNAQIIIATHSPSIIMNKWGNPKYITQMDKITFPTLENID